MKKTLAILMCVLLLAAACVGCSDTTPVEETSQTDAPATEAPSTDDGAATQGETTGSGALSGRTDLNASLSTVISSFDPQYVTKVGEMETLFNIYEPLVTYKDGEVVGVLADEFYANDDSTVYTFKLKQGVLFHNGEELKASDVVFTIERGLAIPNVQVYISGIQSVAAFDDYTVEVTMAKPSGVLYVGLAYTMILNEKFVNDNGGDLSGVTCGTGAYYLDSFVEGESCCLKAFDNYHEGKPAIDTLNLKFFADDNTKLSAFEAGELDYISIPTASWQYIKDTGKYNCIEIETSTVTYMVFNLEVEPLNNKLLRQAIAYAIDRQSIVDMTREGLGSVANVFGKPGMIFGSTDEGVKVYDYDPEKAKELLAEAGYPDGVDIGTMTVFSSGSAVAQIIQSNLADVGITVTIELGDSSTLLPNLAAGKFQVSMSSYALQYDMNTAVGKFNSANINSSNYSRYSNERVDELFSEAGCMADQEGRKELYKELINILQEDLPVLPLYYSTWGYAVNPDLNFSWRAGNSFEYYLDLSWK